MELNHIFEEVLREAIEGVDYDIDEHGYRCFRADYKCPWEIIAGKLASKLRKAFKISGVYSQDACEMFCDLGLDNEENVTVEQLWDILPNAIYKVVNEWGKKPRVSEEQINQFIRRNEEFLRQVCQTNIDAEE